MTNTDKPQGDQEDRWGRLQRESAEMKAMLADCYIALHDHYHEAQPSYDMPPEPADEWSYGIVPMFVAIQRITGKDHAALMLQSK